MSGTDPTFAGWYPDTASRGTRYWDGSKWTGDTRLGRKAFAAASAHRGWGIALTVFGVLTVLTSPSQLEQTQADQTSSMSPVGRLLFAIVLGLALATWGVYLFRGQGPATKAIETRLAADSAASNLRRVARPRSQSVVVNVGASSTGDTAAVAQINALANPETARALQSLQNLLYTQALTDAEFQAAKDKLLGDSTRDVAGTPAGWYDDGAGHQRWWDGRQWTDHLQGDEYEDGVKPLLAFESEIRGKGAVVQIFSDRVEWVVKGGVSAGKVTAGILTAGVSLAVTGVGKGSYGVGGSAGAETIVMSAITHVASATNGNRTVVSITTPGYVLPMRLAHRDAIRVMQALNLLVANAAREATPAAPIFVNINGPTTAAAPVPTVPTAVPDSISQIARLAELHQAGVLTAAEFVAGKAKLLGI
jgi:hypothetical protein